MGAYYCHLIRGEMVVEYRSSTRGLRVILAVAAFVWAFAAATVSPHSIPSAYSVIAEHGGRDPWVVLFALDGLALTWGLVSRYRMVAFRRFVNAATVGIWATIVGASIAAIGAVGAESAAEIALLVGAAWATIRTDRGGGGPDIP